MQIERIDTQLTQLKPEDLTQLEGIGKSISSSILEMLNAGSFSQLDELLSITPPGVVEMLKIKGIGPKKIRQIWKELEVENLEDLMNACKHNKIADLKGFGQKTQENILEQLAFRKSVEGQILIDKAEEMAAKLEKKWTDLGLSDLHLAGDLKQWRGVISSLKWICTSKPASAIRKKLDDIPGIIYQPEKSGPLVWRFILTDNQLPVEIRFGDIKELGNLLIKHTSGEGHLALKPKGTESIQQLLNRQDFDSETSFYKSLDLPVISPEMREGVVDKQVIEGKLNCSDLVEETDLKGILHNHSTYSDGRHTMREMASYCKELGYEYVGITDHSKSAFYAGGLSEEQIIRQHQEIDLLNKELAPFRIFKGIESDILIDGSLDYSEEVLSSFDFVVSSIHSTLSMDEKKATDRLIKAIGNPYTTQLGHPTGRLLLKRKGYPIHHKAVIEACAHYGVTIEINANPWRLDLDWTWIPLAMELGVQISINPDAHEMAGYHDMKYGLYIGRKGGLLKSLTFNAKSRDEVSRYFEERKAKKGIK